MYHQCLSLVSRAIEFCLTVFSDYRYPLKPQNQDFYLVPVHVAKALVRGWLAEAYASDDEGVDSNSGASQLSYHR